jgi:hypothetical protein
VHQQGTLLVCTIKPYGNGVRNLLDLIRKGPGKKCRLMQGYNLAAGGRVSGVPALESEPLAPGL